MADAEQQVVSNTEQQVTSKTPATKQKNPKRVAAGKAVAARTRIAREAQRKTLIEAQSIIAKQQASQADPVSITPPQADPVVDTPPQADPPTKKLLSTTQWLSIISIGVSLAGLYYKREEIKNLLGKKDDPQPRAPPPSPVLTRAPPVIREMD